MDRRLLDYLTDELKRYREMQAIMDDAEQPEFEMAWQRAEAAFDDQFVATASIYAIRRWEAMLGIRPAAADTLEDRRFVILTRLNEKLPYTIRSLRNSLITLCGEEGVGFTMEMLHNEYRLVVRLDLTVKSAYAAVESMLRRIVPANIVIDLALMYNSHAYLSGFTHAELAAYTHQQLREEVLTGA